jgi:AmiR/NasT family two-component response regulator
MAVSDRSRIVIAAGDAQARSHLCAQLSHLGHLVVAHTGSGREALPLIRQVSPDLAIIDVELPDIGGLETSRRIDAEELCPIVLLSASSDSAYIREACSISAIQAFLVKPVYEENLGPVLQLAVARFDQLAELSRLSRRKAGIEGQAALHLAAEHLTIRQHWSLDQAREWILQEARAKRASPDRIAQGNTIQSTRHLSRSQRCFAVWKRVRSICPLST